MDSPGVLGLRVNSAVSASTSTCCTSLSIARTSCRSNASGNRPTLRAPPSASRRAKLRNVVAGLQGIPQVNGTKVNGTRVDGSKINGSTIEMVPEELKGESNGNGSCENGQVVNNTAVIMAIATVAIAAEKERVNGELNGKSDIDNLRLGRLVEKGCLYRQTFVIRSYEVGVNRTASIETLMNLFQEAALNHVWASGLAGEGFGVTQAMARKHLIWVVTRMQVQIDRYPNWGEAVEVDTWVMSSGKNGMRRDWLLRSYKSGEILARATSTWVMMNQSTRRLSKLPDEVRDEIAPYFLDRSALLEKCTDKIPKLGDTAQFIRGNLTPRWNDLDMNHHVNNVKYIGWILESMPTPAVEGYDLTDMILEYRRECGHTDVVESMTSPVVVSHDFEAETSVTFSPLNFGLTSGLSNLTTNVQYTHLLRMQTDGSELVRGKTVWRLKEQS